MTYAYTDSRLTQVSNAEAVVAYEHDEVGRVKQRTQTMGGTAYTHKVEYGPVGKKSETYPSGRVVRYGLDAIGRMVGVRGQRPGQSEDVYAGAAEFGPHGGISSLTYGNGQVETRTWNARLQLQSVQRGAEYALTFRYCPTEAADARQTMAICCGRELGTRV